MPLPDISVYYTGAKADAEEQAWGATQHYRNNARVLNEAVGRYGAKSVLEIGCGSGWLATCLDPGVTRYLGIDANPTFLGWAQKRNPDWRKQFELADVRVVTPHYLTRSGHQPFDLVTAFAFFKHFGLHEWDDVVGNVLTLAPVACVAVQTSDVEFDDGVDYHHATVRQSRFERVVAAVGHEIVEDHVLYAGILDDKPLLETVFVTRRRA